MVEPVAGLAAASAEGVGRGLCLRVLLNNINGLRKKIISKLNDFILVFNLHLTVMPPKNDGIVLPPRLPLVSPPIHSPLRCGRLFLVGCCV
jgi:hypothetical protein